MKLGFTTDSLGVHINGVSASSPVIYSNDMVKDTPDAFYIYLKANRKEVNLVGNISGQQGHTTPNPSETTAELWKQFNDVYNTFKAAGGQNVPSPVMGSRKNLSGGQTTPDNSPGSDLIIAEAKKASPTKLLVIFEGGQVTTVANAVLKDASIIPNIIVFHVSGWMGPNNSNFNAMDGWACQVLIDRGVNMVVWDGDLNSWYDRAGSPQYRGSWNPPINRMPGITFATINNAFANMYRNNFNHMYENYGSVGDGPTLFWFFNNSLWQNVVKRNKQNQTVTTDDYAFLLVSKNNWTQYGPTLSSFMNNPQSYIPVTVEPPVNNAPTISILTPNTTYSSGSSIIITATASDDKAVSKVEFFNGATKLGESLTSPYSWVISNAVSGTYNLTGKATDNEGASTVSAVRVVTVTGVVIPPVEPPPTDGRNEYNVADFGAKGDGNNDDTTAFQNAINAAISGRGDLIIPTPKVEYVITRTLIVKSPTNQVWMNLKAWSWSPAGTNHIEYRGPSNSSVFYIAGLKGSSWDGLKVRLKEGLTGVTVYDFDATPSARSTTFNNIQNFYTDLGNQPNNVGVRFGRLKEGANHADICHYNFINCVIYGKFQDPQPGSIGYQILGRNTLAVSFFNCFTAYCDMMFSNRATDGHRGNGTIFWFSCGSSQNNVEIDIASEQTYGVFGGRFEGTKRTFAQIVDGAHAALTVTAAQIDEIGEGGQFSPFIISSSSTLHIENCIVNQKASNTQPLVKINYNGPNRSTLKISGGAVRSSAPALYTGKNPSFRIYIEGVNKNKLGDIYSTDIWPDERP